MSQIIIRKQSIQREKRPLRTGAEPKYNKGWIKKFILKKREKLIMINHSMQTTGKGLK